MKITSQLYFCMVNRWRNVTIVVNYHITHGSILFDFQKCRKQWRLVTICYSKWQKSRTQRSYSFSTVAYLWSVMLCCGITVIRLMCAHFLDSNGTYLLKKLSLCELYVCPYVTRTIFYIMLFFLNINFLLQLVTIIFFVVIKNVRRNQEKD